MEERFSKYLLYAIGEIFLIVIGVLIAIQVSNWNKNQIEFYKLENYYEKLLTEVQDQILVNNHLIERTENLALMQRRTLKILTLKREEDIPELFDIVGSIATSWTNNYNFETFDEFSRQNLLNNVENIELKKLLTQLKKRLVGFDEMNDYISRQYTTLIEPFFAKNINYSRTALAQYREKLIQGGPDTDPGMLFNSMDLWNVSTLKLETTNSTIDRLNNMSKLLNELDIALCKELSKN